MKRNDATAPAGSWAVNALLALGGWLVVSPLVLSTTRVNAGLVSAVTGGLALAVLAGWARVARNRIPPLAIACFLGLWLLLAPSMWEFGDGVDSDPGLVPINPSDVTEPTRAIVDFVKSVEESDDYKRLLRKGTIAEYKTTVPSAGSAVIVPSALSDTSSGSP